MAERHMFDVEHIAEIHAKVREGCSPSYHEALRTVWRVGQDLTHIGVQDFGDGRRLELCNCKKCDSTLARVMRRSEMPPPPMKRTA